MNDNKALYALSENVDRCIRILSEKFKKWPYNFFTESDAHSYLYYSFFRYGSPALKKLYSSVDNLRSVLIHREYPTFYRYLKKTMKRFRLDEPMGACGHYDMVVLNPEFIASYDIQRVISKDNTLRKTVNFDKPHLLTAIEFKLIHKPLSQNMIEEIWKDFVKLDWALDVGQAQDVYVIIFNRYGEERKYWDLLENYREKYPRVKLLYQESYYRDKKHKTYIKSYFS